MVALCNRADHYIFAVVSFYLLFFLVYFANNLYFKIGSVWLCVTRFSASINPLYPATDCAAATGISGVSGRWQLSR